jgi:hypothetical protein
MNIKVGDKVKIIMPSTGEVVAESEVVTEVQKYNGKVAGVVTRGKLGIGIFNIDWVAEAL